MLYLPDVFRIINDLIRHIITQLLDIIWNCKIARSNGAMQN